MLEIAGSIPNEKPLFVRAAEAIGWTETRFEGWRWDDGGAANAFLDQREWKGISPWSADRRLRQSIPNYAKNWEAWSGHLLERYVRQINITPRDSKTGRVVRPCTAHLYVIETDDLYTGTGDTTLEAVCDLVILLDRVGMRAKLDEAER